MDSSSPLTSPFQPGRHLHSSSRSSPAFAQQNSMHVDPDPITTTRGIFITDRFSRHSELKGPQEVKKVLVDIERRSSKKHLRDGRFRDTADGLATDMFQRKPTKRLSNAYKPHSSVGVQLTVFQEFLIWGAHLRQGVSKEVLAERFFGISDKNTTRRMTSVLRTWIKGMGTVLRAAAWWVHAGQTKAPRPEAFACEEAVDVTVVADCTNGMQCQGSELSELIEQQLFSPYYKM